MTALLILCVLFTAPFGADAQTDTIFVDMEIVQGFGEIEPMSSMTRKMDADNPWFGSNPEVTGIPDDLEEYTLLIEKVDFVQHAYQSMKAGLLDSAFVMGAFANWGENPADYSKEYLDVYIAMLVWEDDETTYIKMANGIPLDFSESEKRILPEPKGFMDPESLVSQKITYQIYIEGELETRQDWFRAGLAPDLGQQTDFPGFVLFTGMHSHRKGQAVIDGHTHDFLLHNHFSGVRFKKNNAQIVSTGEDGEMNMAGVGQMIQVGNHHYRFEKVNIDGSRITLVPIQDISSMEGNQVGLKAFDFSHTTINGENLTLSELEGNYVFLDFWGTWCAPCIHEMPYLKEVYRLFGGHGFEMIGIAFDQPEDLESFVEEWEIDWPQILQVPGTDPEIIERYNIRGYPTTYLLDTERVIVESGLREFSIEKKLTETLGLSEAVIENIKAGSYLLQIEAPDAETVHISGKNLPFRSRIPLFNIDQSWTRGLELEPGIYEFSVYIDGEPGEVEYPGKTTTDDGKTVYRIEVD